MRTPYRVPWKVAASLLLISMAFALVLISGGADITVSAIKAYAAMPEVNPRKAETATTTVQEQLWSLLEQHGLTLEERIEAMAIVRCESRYNQYAINKNKGGSLDLGLWQLNEKYNPTVSRDCAFSVQCSTARAMEIYRKRGWQPWVCAK